MISGIFQLFHPPGIHNVRNAAAAAAVASISPFREINSAKAWATLPCWSALRH